MVRKRLLLAEVDRVIRSPYLSYGDTVRQIGELIEQEQKKLDNDGSAPCPECGSKTVECLEFCDCHWCAEGVARPTQFDGTGTSNEGGGFVGP